jgi:uncharacterized protein (TIGR00251 family)
VIALAAHARGTLLPVHAQPGARRNAVLGTHADAVRVAVSAPADKGRANGAIQELLAEALGCKASQVELVSGASSRRKRFLIVGITTEQLLARLAPLLAPKPPGS